MIVPCICKGCQDNEKCVHIKECPEMRILARRVKNAKDESKKIEILSKIKSRLCGAKRAFSVCCEADDEGSVDNPNVEIEDLVEIELDEDVVEDEEEVPQVQAKDPCKGLLWKKNYQVRFLKKRKNKSISTRRSNYNGAMVFGSCKMKIGQGFVLFVVS